MTTVRHDDERAHLYPEGGIGYETHVRGIGWVVDFKPSGMIQRLARAVYESLRGDPFAGSSEDELNQAWDELDAKLGTRE